MRHPLADRTRVGSTDNAIAIANRTYRNTPAYAIHVRDHWPKAGIIRTEKEFRALPPVTKKNYLTQHRRTDLMRYADAAAAGIWSTSSGSTGISTYFPRDDGATLDSASIFEPIFENFGSRARTTLVVNAFAMGTWIGGTYTFLGVLELRRRGHRISVITPGIDIDAILAALTEIGPHYEQIVLAGYPPFVKEVLDAASHVVLAQDIKLLLAGEAITEDWRDHMLRRMGHPNEPARICLKYGTADAGVIAHETPTTIALRRAAGSHNLLQNRLFGDCELLPTLVEIDPMLRFVEADDDGYLLFTIDAAMPLVRYRINDRGSVFTGSEVGSILGESKLSDFAAGVDPNSVFVSLTGRPDVAAIFYSLNVYDGNLRAAFEHPTVVDALTGRFVIHTEADSNHNPRLHIDAELSASTRPDEVLRLRLTELCTGSLCDSNSEYRELHRSHGSTAVPVVALYEYRTHRFAAVGPKHNSTVRNDRSA